ncbi:MAG: branched-chain amino acid ABC transporter permease [Paracoccus denitrificans]|uniref:Branched-chain amino acid ABC transporter permease n=1 Tax=Paracoccus denitrificans TaxID=266 RepID=A0A533I7J5_PARDE|nr:MAG: branched-chain amino acid ABC transporter permease [Paracoccus denitrificans]
MFRLTRPRLAVFVLSLAMLTCIALFGGFFAREVVAEIAILAILVIALDVAAGFGGMVSLGHGAIMGVGAYGFGLACQSGIAAWPAAGIGIAAAALTGGMIGTVAIRAQGIFFIMVTLAFGQMIWTVTHTATWTGGDDGMSGLPRLPLPLIDPGDPRTFALLALAVLAAVFLIAAALLCSPFGRALQAVHENPLRAAAIGFPVQRLRIAAFTLSSAIAGIAGVIMAQHMQFISPTMMVWTASGEALVVLILGGIGTLVGPIIGAMAYVGLKYWASGWTDHWHILIGVLLIAVVMAGGRGLFGQAENAWRHADR